MNYQPSILIVDDEKGLRNGTKRLLENEGYSVDTAENGTEGIQKGITNDYDLALIDLRMPDVDGLDVLTAFRKNKPETVCFISTAFASYDSAVESAHLGSFAYIPKPFTPEELLQQLRQGYNRRKLLLESKNLKKEREKNLFELAFEKSRLNTIVQSINEGILIINSKYEVVYFNSALLRLFNINELRVSDVVTEKLPADLFETAEKLIQSDLKSDKSFTKQIEMKAGELFVEVAINHVKDPHGFTVGAIFVVNDISELKKIERIKNQFVSMVAHELKTPIVAVDGFIRIILDKSIKLDESKKTEFLKRSVSRLSSMITLVNDLLDISRMELKNKFRIKNDIDLIPLIQSIINSFEVDFKARKLNIRFNYSTDRVLFFADENEINRLFTNLISNAIKYNKVGGSILVNISDSGNFYIIEIIDSGIGLREKERKQLFEEFFRAKNSSTRGIPGTGLGLTIVKRIVENYHGKIEVESEYEKGSNFKIYLPNYKISKQITGDGNGSNSIN